MFRHMRRGQGGYSLIELMFVTGIAGVLSAVAVVQIGSSRSVLSGDAAMRVVLAQLNQAREKAITQRKYIEITFDTTLNQVSILREDTNATPPATTTLSTIGFEGTAKIALLAGVPDTPDAFGKTLATSFTSTGGTFASATGTTTIAKFTPDGSLVDWNGRTTNGTVFLAIANQPMSVRAATILGSTGRVRGFRWNGRVWTKV
jgi:prepilin-type N-terminal cleavage/methylation domain-containing protein